MNFKYILAAGMMAATTVAGAQEWTADTINTGIGYANDGFYNLNATQSGYPANNNWDIAFVTGKIFSTAVFLNHSGNGKSAKLYRLSVNAAEDFGTDLTADTVGLTTEDELQNSPFDWENGAFNKDIDGPTSYGWGEYDMLTHFITGNKVYALVNASGAYQVWIEQYKSSADVASRHWIFHTAKLDGSDTAHFDFVPADYGDKLFAYFDISTGEFLNREPDMDNWHLLATRYLDTYSGPGGPGLMSTTGIVSNENVEVAKAEDILADEADYTDYSDNYDTVKNIIGGSYKFLDYTIPGWVIEDSLSYFIKITSGTGAGDIWQVYFDYFPQSTTTPATDVKIGLQKRKVYAAPVSTDDIDVPANAVVVAPNPAEHGITNLLIDAKQNINNAQITVADISGRVVYKTSASISAGFHQLPLDISNLTPGLYLVNISSNNWSNTQKLSVK